ncbi:MAG: peptidoglycan-binding domain-containing protein [Bacteroidota bacterium]
MSDHIATHQATTAPAQFETEGGASMAPPAFSLGASPVQMQDDGDGGMCGGETDASELTCEPDISQVPASSINIDTGSAITYNNGKEFMINWVRNLQLELLGNRTSRLGEFDEATVIAVARFQTAFSLPGGVDGKIGGNTRRALEQHYPRLLNSVIGTNLQPRVLVPGNATDQDKYGYYRSIIENAGGTFYTGHREMNLLGIRGAKVADGSDAHQVNGQNLAAGTIYQTPSAADYAAARAAGTVDDHTSGDHQGFDDMMMSIWVENAENGDPQIQVRERIGNVDPRSLWTDDRYGTGHLVDGQHAYRTGTHGTRSSSHQDAVRGIDDPGNWLREGMSGGKLRYRALIPDRNQEAWREHNPTGTSGRHAGNDRHISTAEETQSREEIYDRNGRYVNNNFAMNIHTSANEHPNSQACMNVPADEYLEYMQEIYRSENDGHGDNDPILFTLIDASKIENGLVLMSQADQ